MQRGIITVQRGFVVVQHELNAVQPGLTTVHTSAIRVLRGSIAVAGCPNSGGVSMPLQPARFTRFVRLFTSRLNVIRNLPCDVCY